MGAIVRALVSTGDETVQEDALDVLELRLMTNARDQVKVLLFDLSIDRIVWNELSNIFVVPTLTPHVANPDQNPSRIDNPGKLEPGLNCCIVQQAEQPMDRGNLFDSSFLVRLVQAPTDVLESLVTVDQAALLEMGGVTMSKDRIQGPRPMLPSP